MAAACQEHPEWLAHSLEIAERCHFEMPFGKPQFPAFVPPDGSTPREFLHHLVLDGLRRRYGERAAAMRPQVEQELSIITAVGYEEYFLVVWNILQDCRAHGIEWITRGSAADSLVCYCLGISDVCPVRFGLYFRRFLNQERMALNKLPDIDVDFPARPQRRRGGSDLCQIRPGALRRGGRLLDLPGPQRLCGRGEGAGRGRTRSAPVHRTFPVELWRRLGAGRTHARAAGRSCANCSRPAPKTATCR